LIHQVGLPNDELCRRKIFRGVYSTPDEIADNHYALYVLCEAQTFHKQLPLTPKVQGDPADADATTVERRMFTSADFYLFGYITAFTNLRALQMFANARFRSMRAYYYVMQIDSAKLTHVEDITIVEAGDEASCEARDGDVVLDKDEWGSTPGHGDQVRIHGVINVEAIDRIWVAERAGEHGFEGAFIDCTPPGHHNMVIEPKKP
jgi:hypothetical protein